ncbi:MULTISPECIES: hypothetical protein [Inquilinus]|uniref:Glycine zipper family protein n=1 Tax=Inquilinus ginsengisoli TaxID=363840 RepID=A0ABU1JK14_9PROT|nr:hypothetical protein [Inquilinus ginsengisoli]MDR6288951.1 hypothetical protein [Inquilinus ginsengisoli]
MRQQDRVAPKRDRNTEARFINRRAPLIAVVSVLLSACSVYDMHPDIDPYASRDGGVHYEADLKLCQDHVAGQPSSRPNGAMLVAATTMAGATIAGGGATLFNGNVRNAAGLGALTGAAAGFNGLAASMTSNGAVDDLTLLQICLMKQGYTVVWGNGFRMPAFKHPPPE